MAVEGNKAIVNAFFEQVFNNGNLDAIKDFCVPGSMLAGGLPGQVMSMKSMFPDNQVIIDEMITEGDKVVALVTTRGTNLGPMIGFPAFGKMENPVPATGVEVMSTGIYVFTIREGVIVSIQSEMDQIGILQQLGWQFSPPAQN